MTDLSAQKRLAADVLDVGKNRVWFDPDAQSDISEAITREDIRELVNEGTIRAEEKRGNSKGRSRERKAKRAYGHQKGPGKRRGKKGGRSDPKKEWQNRIRAQRKKLHELRAEGEIDRTSRDRRRRPTGGATGHPVGVERVSRRAEVRGFGRRTHAELVHVRLADDGRPRLAEWLYHRHVVWRDVIGQHGRATCRGHAGRTDVVLDGDRPSGECAIVRAFDRFPRDEGVEIDAHLSPPAVL